MPVTNSGGTITYSPQATELWFHPFRPFPSLVSHQWLKPRPSSPLFSMLMQQRNDGQTGE